MPDVKLQIEHSFFVLIQKDELVLGGKSTSIRAGGLLWVRDTHTYRENETI